MVVPDEGGGRFCVIAPVHQKRQILRSGIELSDGFGPEFNCVLKDVAPFDCVHGYQPSFEIRALLRLALL